MAIYEVLSNLKHNNVLIAKGKLVDGKSFTQDEVTQLERDGVIREHQEVQHDAPLVISQADSENVSEPVTGTTQTTHTEPTQATSQQVAETLQTLN